MILTIVRGDRCLTATECIEFTADASAVSYITPAGQLETIDDATEIGVFDHGERIAGWKIPRSGEDA